MYLNILNFIYIIWNTEVEMMDDDDDVESVLGYNSIIHATLLNFKP